MTCIKTGCHVYIEPYDEWAYGDAFSAGDVYWFRVCNRQFGPIYSRKHFTIHDFHDWFDKYKTSQSHNSTLISSSVTNHGYEGVAI